MSVGQEFAVSAMAAGLSHILHHPLYTLKSQMMFYGPEFRFKMFVSKAREHKSFLYRGTSLQCIINCIGSTNVVLTIVMMDLTTNTTTKL